jgi:hypothetical protein
VKFRELGRHVLVLVTARFRFCNRAGWLGGLTAARNED